jgi:phosphatidylserine/phosphatidylglycerophosphate/cardiolipin synthase-like enzyme
MVGGVDQAVVAVLNKAQKTIDLASFDFTLPSVADALVAAQKRGVKVRIIVDDKNGEQELKQDSLVKAGGQPFEKVKAAGIPVVGGGRSNGLMHNKMIIVDSSTLFMGSWNMSYNDTFRNNNNLLQITSQKLIENYQAKFNEGFEKGLFGAKALLNSPNPKLSIGGVDVEQYFAPDDKVMDKLVAEVNKATKSVKFMAFTYTHKNLSSAMIARFQAGVVVQGVIENRGASQGALVPLFCAKVPVLTDGNTYTMHHKVIIIDDSTVITGSFNFTASADESNDDNVIIIRSKTVAAAYLDEFAKIYGQGVKPDAAKIDCSKAN